MYNQDLAKGVRYHYLLPFLCAVSGLSLNLPNMLKQKEEAVKGLTSGVAYLFKNNKVRMC